MTVIIEVNFSEVLLNAVVGEDVRSFDQISQMLGGSGVFGSGSFWRGVDFAECVAEVLEGHWFEGVMSVVGSLPPMYTPSPESPADSMTCVKGARDVGHRCLEPLQ